MNLDQDFFQENKLSENQKKDLHQKWNTFFPQIQEKTKKEKFFTRNGTLFLSTDLRSDAHWSQIIGGTHMKTILKLLGVYSQIIGGIYPPSPPCFGTTARNRSHCRLLATRLSLIIFLHCYNVYDTKVLPDPTFEKRYFLSK